MFHGLYSLAESLAILWFGYLPWLWNQIPKLAPPSVAAWLDNEIVHTVVFALAMSSVSLITSIPWSLYSTFVVEQKHGFNKQTPG